MHRLPLSRLQRDTWLLRERRLERGGRLYERLGIRRWKDRAARGRRPVRRRDVEAPPPAAGDVASLERFAAETRRAELGHWAAMACGPLFVLWNPPAVAAVMVAYGVGVNMPFIAIQRYNRARIGRLLGAAHEQVVDRRRPGGGPTAVGVTASSNGSSIP